MPGRTYSRLHDQAVDQYGYITTRDAAALGVHPDRLQKMKDRGVLSRVDRGIFRFEDIPVSALDQYAAATLWPLEVRGVLSHATALDLHDVCDVNPVRVDVTVPRSFRTTRTPPDVVRLHREAIATEDLTWHEGLPIVGVGRAIRGAIDVGVGWYLVEQAIDTALRTGRLPAAEAAAIRALRPRDSERARA